MLVRNISIATYLLTLSTLAHAAPVIVGHRGTTTFGPENTIAGFLAAVEHGAQLLEMDIRTTKDGHLVVIHDASVDRTTDGEGLVRRMTLEEIKKLDAGSWFDAKFGGERVPTFAEVLDAIKGKALPDLDIKDADADQIVAVLKEKGFTEGITVYSGNWKLLSHIKELLPGVLIRPTVPGTETGLETIMTKMNPDIVNIDWGQYTPQLIEQIHARGKKAFLNTMQAEDEKAAIAESIKVGADYIQSDDLAELVRQVKGVEKTN